MVDEAATCKSSGTVCTPQASPGTPRVAPCPKSAGSGPGTPTGQTNNVNLLYIFKL